MKLNLGENIRKNRTRLGWTQGHLAERLGTSVQSVSRWESGGGYPDMELLPVLARTFAVSVDDLLGCGEGEKSDYEELRVKLFNAVHVGKPSAEKVVGLLRKIRTEYPEKAALLAGTLYGIPPAELDHSPEILRELRMILDEEEKRSGSPHKTHLLRTMAKYEDESHFRELVSRYVPDASTPLSRLTLLMDRAESQGDWERFRKLKQQKLAEDFRDFLKEQAMHINHFRPDGAYDYDALPPADAEYAAKVSERKLQLLHSFNGMQAEKQYPLSANGEADMWTPVRVELGERYAAQLAALGETDRALTVLEDIAGLAEQSCAFPDLNLFRDNAFSSVSCPRTAVISPFLPDVGAYRYPRPSAKMVCFMFSCSDPLPDISFAGILNYPALWNFLTKRASLPSDQFRVPWLDPIRDHPRYKAVVERIRTCLDILTLP